MFLPSPYTDSLAIRSVFHSSTLDARVSLTLFQVSKVEVENQFRRNFTVSGENAFQGDYCDSDCIFWDGRSSVTVQEKIVEVNQEFSPYLKF